MPEVCRFTGVRIAIFNNDHAPPHFHVAYAEYAARVGIEPAVVLDGELPPRIQNQVLRWAWTRRAELLRAWEQAQARVPVERIDP